MIIVVLVLLSRALTTVGAPAINAGHLQARRQGDQNDPFDIWFNCEGTEAVCNADCMSILCFGAPNPVQRDEINSSDGHRKDAWVQ